MTNYHMRATCGGIGGSSGTTRACGVTNARGTACGIISDARSYGGHVSGASCWSSTTDATGGIIIDASSGGDISGACSAGSRIVY